MKTIQYHQTYALQSYTSVFVHILQFIPNRASIVRKIDEKEP